MKLSEHWLREWVNPPLSREELTARLTQAGLELASIEPVASDFNQVVVGDVVTATPLPESTHLTVCQVNAGTTTPVTVVCGAPNVRAGARFPLALVGARLPNNVKIKKTKLRGVVSEGMLCSAKELDLGDWAEGIMPLPDDAPVGEDIRRYLNLNDVSIDIDLTPNRGDCLSVEGIAREVSVLTECPLTPVATTPVPAMSTETFPITLHNSSACPRYVGRLIRAINPQAPTPVWLQERLRRSGQRSISAVVDVTNYVLLELGQPLHAFDFSRLQGGIDVRLARTGESLTLLDKQTVALDEMTLIIADHAKPLAIAGVMGGLDSAVTATTQDIFLESAFFSPRTLAGCARRYGLQTDSAYRFERGVDPFLQRRALERATALLLSIVGGTPGPTLEIVAETALPERPTITLRLARVERLLGYSLPKEKITRILKALGMAVQEFDAGWQVQPPWFRVFDLTQEADLVEEIARVHGYHQIPQRLPKIRLTSRAQPAVRTEQFQSTLVQRGYQEAITYSFVDPKLQANLNPTVPAVALTNPLSSDMAVMRTTLWSGLLPILQYNQQRQQQRIRLFEIGLRFTFSESQDFQQEKMIAGVVSGSRYPEQWGESAHPVDFFDVKADVEALLQLMGTTYQFKPTVHPALQPGQTAAINCAENWRGILGAFHPRWLQKLDLTPPVYGFELRLDVIGKHPTNGYREVPKFPSIRRDIAIIVAQTVSAQDVLAGIEQLGIPLLVEMRLFDVYQGQGIEVGKKSLAIGLIFQALSRNLTEAEIDLLVKHIVEQLEQTLNAQLRK